MMNPHSLILSTLKLFLLSLAIFGEAPALYAQIVSYNFDWDDNVFYMPTRIYLHSSSCRDAIGLTTKNFAEIRDQLGKPGPYSKYYVDESSFRGFRDNELQSPFIYDVITMLRGYPHNRNFMGPSFRSFQEAMSNPLTRLWTFFISARGHSSENMAIGLEIAKNRGLIDAVPPTENLIGVSNPKFRGKAADPSNIKVIEMMKILDRLNAQPFNLSRQGVILENGSCCGLRHLWGFSDDDRANFDTAARILSEQIKKGRWPKVKITLLFTGDHDPDHRISRYSPQAYVIQRDGNLRSRKREEDFEPQKLLGLKAFR